MSDSGWLVLVLPLLFPALLLVLLMLLGSLEARVTGPDQRAAEIVALLEDAETVEQVEQEVRQMVARHAPGRALRRRREPGGARMRQALARVAGRA